MEAGGRAQYRKMMESPELRRAFIRKLHVILSLELLLAIAVTAAVVFLHPISPFFTATVAGSVVHVVLIITPFTVMTPLYHYYQSHTVNYILIAIYTVSFSIEVGLACTYANGKLILEAAILTGAMVVIFTLFTLWVASRGRDFNFVGPFLFAVLLVLILIHFQMYFPLGKLKVMFFGCLESIILSAYIVYDTDYLIKRYSYNGFLSGSHQPLSISVDCL